MWVLLIMFFLMPDQNTVLKRFATWQACQDARKIVGYEMAESYPLLEDMDFEIVCQFRAVSNRLLLASH